MSRSGARHVVWHAGQSPPASAAGIGWLLGSSPLDASTLGSSPHTGSSLPLPHFQHPSYELLNTNGFQQMKYDRWKQRCLDERSHTGQLLLTVGQQLAPIARTLERPPAPASP